MVNKIEKPLAQLKKIKRKIQITKTKNESRDIAKNLDDIKSLLGNILDIFMLINMAT